MLAALLAKGDGADVCQRGWASSCPVCWGSQWQANRLERILARLAESEVVPSESAGA